MTLATNIYILGKIDGPDLHAWVNKNLLRVENPIVIAKTLGEVYPHPWRDDETEIAQSHQLHNRLGQGFDAIFQLDWWDEPETYDSWVTSDTDDEDAEYHRHQQEKIGAPYYAHIDFDTAYGFNRDGLGCTELHATYIVRLYREYFEPRGIDIAWQDEYSGDIWKNLDQVGMTKFLGGGEDAMDWFQNIAKPAVEKAAEGKIDWDITPPSV